MPTTKTKSEQDRDLNKDLERTFPASDPPSSNQVSDKPDRPAGRKPALIDKQQVERLAEEAEQKSQET